MENFIKALSISLLMSGSFIINAMDSEEDMARSFGMTLREYRRQVSAQQQLFSQPELSRDNTDPELEKGLAASLGMSVPAYRRQLEKEQEEKASAELIRRLQAKEQQEKASVELIRHLQAKEQQEKASVELIHRLQREEEEKATAELIRRLQKEQEEKDSDEELVRHFQQTHILDESSFKSQIQQKTRTYSHGTERPILEKYIHIFEYLSKIAQGLDVHVLDDYVFGSHKMIDALLEVGRLYSIDKPDLTLAQVGQEMVTFVNAHKDFFNTYKYENTALTGERVIAILNSHFSNMDAEVRAICPAAREVWSRAWTLALNLYNRDKDSSAIQVIFDQAVEGHLTRGGCIQGRIDRGFVGYVSLLAKSGVNLY